MSGLDDVLLGYAVHACLQVVQYERNPYDLWTLIYLSDNVHLAPSCHCVPVYSFQFQ